jgi:NAD(P)H-hydrate epimerase
MRVVSSKEMRALEKITIEEIGFSEELIIENVGRSAAEYIEHIENIETYTNEIVVLVGQGNNGSDGLAMARHMVNKGLNVRAFLLFEPLEKNKVFQKQLELAHQFGVKITNISKSDQLESYFNESGGSFIIVDAILGLGTRLPLSNYLFDIVNVANRYASFMIAIDIPTGIACDNGIMEGNAIKADLTMAVGLPKYAHYIGSGAVHSGQTVVLDGCFPQIQTKEGDKRLLTIDTVQGFHLDRNKFAHKNTFGHCLVVGGSSGLTGAVNLASMAALKVGTGLVTASTWKEHYGELCTRVIPEIMTGVIPVGEEEVDDIIKRLSGWDSIVVGPGLGRDERSREVVLEVLNHFSGPVIVDADAIRVLSFQEDKELINNRKYPTIFTPHMGEFSAFVGVETSKVLERPLEYLKEIIEEMNCCFVMKGPASYIGFPDGQIFINYYPNDGMATAGSGDVLAGIIGGLLAQYTTGTDANNPFYDNTIVTQSICLGMLVHSLAGKAAAEIEGVRAMTAGTIIKNLGKAFAAIENENQDA